MVRATTGQPVQPEWIAMCERAFRPPRGGMGLPLNRLHSIEMKTSRTPEPNNTGYRHRKEVLQWLALTGSGDVVHDLLRAAFDRYRISAWCGNEERGAKEAIAILERVVASQKVDEELREAIVLTVASVKSLEGDKRLQEIMLRREGLMPEGWRPE